MTAMNLREIEPFFIKESSDTDIPATLDRLVEFWVQASCQQQQDDFTSLWTLFHLSSWRTPIRARFCQDSISTPPSTDCGMADCSPPRARAGDRKR
mmetsp:Transcript_10593/g.23524  ORF Transcript_10593/g.23524 Transcript_10593/m.23524 type:complete len:96 (-) Transcript_10593:345-632(-)